MRNTAKNAFRPGTQANHKVMMRTYVAFCAYFSLQDLDPSPTTVCAYIQFLTRSFASPKSINNYVAAISLLHHMANRQPPTKTFAVTSMLRAVHLTKRHIPLQKLPIDSDLLNTICNMCDTQGDQGVILKAAFTLLYFTFVRQSNIAPRKSELFDPTCHLARGDIFFSPPGYIVLIKWTKTLQSGKYALLPVPEINHIHCPVAALKNMMSKHPPKAKSNSPLFILPKNKNKSITVSYLSDALGIILQSLNIPAQLYSLHSFRRGGATAVFQAGVHYTKVKHHGLWSSDCFWQYITTNTLGTDIPQALAKSFQQK